MDCCGPPTRAPSTASIPETGEGEVTDFRKPDQVRECKDVFSLMVFSVFAVYMVCVAIAAASRRDYVGLLHYADSFGNLCGLDNRNRKLIGVPLSGQDMRERKLLEKSDSVWMCVEKCEKESVGLLPYVCPAQAAEMRQLVLREKDAKILAGDLLWQMDGMCYVVLIGIGITVVWMLCLRFWISIFSWLVMMASALSTLAFTITLWLAWGKDITLYEHPPTDVIESSKHDERSSLWVLVLLLLTILTVLILLMIAVVVKKVTQVFGVLQEAARALGDVPSVFGQAVMAALVIVVIAGFWLLGLVAMLSVVHPFIDDAKQRTVGFDTDNFFLTMCPPYVIFFLWLANIVLSCQHFVVASAIATWYFTKHKTHISAPVVRSMQLLVGYHLGSIIYGSLVLIVADPLRAVISGSRLVFNDKTQAGASVAKFLRPCCSCLDRFLMHLNRKAYIIMAIHGLSFRTSGRRALRLLGRHCQQVAGLDTVTGFLLFLAKFNTALLAVFSGLWIIKETQTTVYIWAPLIAAGCISYYIADSCISVYEVTVDTLFLCFTEDCEQNNGVTKPYFVTDSLSAFMHDTKNDLQNNASTRVTSLDDGAHHVKTNS
ncbi:choline transporter-like protein 1 isoform X2 [Rhipicephalus microplus]|uniref:choline transporter-like protein 1 isoform X2 n=1 Tax=Rhipicephalus microplus TaxID=6941 RepID=UPI003F6B6E27